MLFSRSFASSFKDIEAALNKGYYAAGFFSYEAGYNFEDRLREDKNYAFPLIYIVYMTSHLKKTSLPVPGIGPSGLKI